MTITLAKDVEEFVNELLRAGAGTDTDSLVNDILRSHCQHQRGPFEPSLELEAWLLESAESPVSPLLPADFEAIKDRARS